MKNYLIITGIIIIGIGVYFLLPSKQPPIGANASPATRACTPVTVNKQYVGNANSLTILSANSLRAWARIENLVNATNTIHLAFASGTSATVNSGFILTEATSTSPVPYIDFGLNTDIPYVGAVTGITNKGSTTINVTECVYQ